MRCILGQHVLTNTFIKNGESILKIILDAMGGDNAPLAALQGAQQAVEELGIEVIAVGHKEKMEVLAKASDISLEGITLYHASQVVEMDEEPAKTFKHKPDSSLAVALNLLAKGEGEAMVSAGSTGALLVGSTLVVKRIKGIKRAAIGTVIPSIGDEINEHWILVDSGANVECRPDMLVQFAAMGSAYMENVMEVPNPSVGLINNGTEEGKGTELQKQAFPLIQKSGLNFAGNVEGRDIASGIVSVAVCDGFTGNIILKMVEGVVNSLLKTIKNVLTANMAVKFGTLFIKGSLGEVKSKLDYTEHGGAPLLGLTKPVIKAHGSSNAKAIKNALRQAKLCVDKNVCQSIEEWVSKDKSGK